MLNIFRTDPRPLSIDTFGQQLFDLPAELLELILSLCSADKALLLALKYDAIFHSARLKDGLKYDYALGTMASTVLQKDVLRHRITTAIHASHILPKEVFSHTFTRRLMELLPRMRAAFREYGGVKYLHDLHGNRTDIHRHTSGEEIDFAISTPPQTLSLQVHDLGITNIAFNVDKHGRLRWIRETPDTHRIFQYRSRDLFTALTVVSDVSIILPLQIKMSNLNLLLATKVAHGGCSRLQ